MNLAMTLQFKLEKREIWLHYFVGIKVKEFICGRPSEEVNKEVALFDSECNQV